MAVVAYTLVRVGHREIRKIVNKINKLQFVREVTPVYGEYDIIVETRTESIEELTLFIYNRLRRISDLTMTTTMITAKVDEK